MAKCFIGEVSPEVASSDEDRHQEGVAETLSGSQHGHEGMVAEEETAPNYRSSMTYFTEPNSTYKLLGLGRKDNELDSFENPKNIAKFVGCDEKGLF